MVLKLGNFLAGLFSKVVLNVLPGPFNTIYTFLLLSSVMYTFLNGYF